MLFERRLREGIHDGSITAMFRRWRRPQVVVGGRYRTGLDMIEVVSVEVVAPNRIRSADARRAGYPDVAASVADLRGSEDDPVYQIEFRRLDGADPRAVLAADDALSPTDLADIRQRLARMDRLSTHGPWTTSTLALIDEQPEVLAARLAESMGLPTDVFKRDVRKLKALGLTVSYPVGYRLSARGHAYTRATEAEA